MFGWINLDSNLLIIQIWVNIFRPFLLGKPAWITSAVFYFYTAEGQELRHTFSIHLQLDRNLIPIILIGICILIQIGNVSWRVNFAGHINRAITRYPIHLERQVPVVESSFVDINEFETGFSICTDADGGLYSRLSHMILAHFILWLNII